MNGKKNERKSRWEEEAKAEKGSNTIENIRIVGSCQMDRNVVLPRFSSYEHGIRTR